MTSSIAKTNCLSFRDVILNEDAPYKCASE